MKKTSGFFKRRFGSTPGASESTNNLSDLVNVQHSRHFSSQSDHHLSQPGTESCPSSPALPHSLHLQRPTPPPPPVPTIPSSYIQNNPPATLSPTQSDKRSNVKSAAQSTRSSPSPLSPSPSQRKARERTDDLGPDPAITNLNRSRSASPPRHDAAFAKLSSFKPARNHYSHPAANPEDPHALTFHRYASNIELNSQNSPRQRTSMSSLSAAVASLQPFDSAATKPSPQLSTPASQLYSVTGASPFLHQPPGSVTPKSNKSNETGRDITSPIQSESNPFKRPLKPYPTEAHDPQRDSDLSPRSDSLLSGVISHDPLSLPVDQSTQGTNPLIQVNTDFGVSKTHSNLPSAGSTASFFSTMSENGEEGKARVTEVTPKNPFHRQNSVPHTPPIGGPTRFQSPLPRSGHPHVLPNLDTSSAVTGRSAHRPPESNRNSRAESLNDMRIDHSSNHRAAMARDLSLPVWTSARSASAESCPASVPSDLPVHNPLSPTLSDSPWSGRQRSPHPYLDSKLTGTPGLTNRLRTETEESTMSNKTLNIHALQDSRRATGDGHGGRVPDASQQFDDTSEADLQLNHTPSIRLVSAPETAANATDGATPSSMAPSHLGSPYSQQSSTYSGYESPSPMLPEHHRNPFSPNWSGQTVPLPKDTTPVGLGLKLERSPDASELDPPTPANDQEEQKKRVSRTGLDRTSSLSRSLASSSITSSSPSTMPLRASGPSTRPHTGQEDNDGCSLGPVISKQRTVSTTSTMNSTKRSNDTRSTAHTSVHPNDFVDPTLSVDENAKMLARRCWDEDESFIRRDKLAEWLGSPDTGENQLPVLTLKHYMNCFAFHQLRIDMAFRKLCQKLHLKGETQQIDRILVEFSQRFWQQNFSNLYFSTDVVHALSYSILLLNTDLHIVDTTSRMSRSQFVRNTLETLTAQLSAFEDLGDVEHVIDSAERDTPMSMSDFISYSRPSSPSLRTGTIGRGSQASKKSSTDVDSFVDSHTKPPHSAIGRPSIDKWRGPFRNGSNPGTAASRLPRRSGSVASSAHPFVMVNGPPELPGDASRRGSNELASPAASMAPQEGMIKPSQFSRALFEKEIEGLLKTQPIFQGLNTDGQPRTPGIGGTRSPGALGAERPQPPFKRNSLRGLPGFGGLLAAHGAEMYGPRSSSPTSSTAPSTMSGTSGPGGLAQSNSSTGSHRYTNMTSPSIGFASNLSQSIIREQTEEESKEDPQEPPTLMSDEELALLGAPWAKEGLLQRKQYWDAKGKRHKDKGWAQLFVVIHKGQLKMFQFGATGPSMSSSNQASGDGPTVGGGNWLSNAQPMGELTLTHSLSSALPSGYNRDRPCAFVLTLANESSYFFQAGTADLVNEWVSTCNYWSARLSKEPLTGGVSNMEYGWNQVADLAAIRMSSISRKSNDYKGDEESEGKVESQPTRSKKLRQKIIKPNSSGNMYSMSGSESVKGSVADLRLTHNQHQHHVQLPQAQQPPNQINSNVMINDWSAPIPPNSTSTLTEENQLDNLRKHSIYMQLELEKHNYLRKPMMSLYPTRSLNFQKATNNWEKKSQYLLAEIIKYTTYIDALECGIHQKNEKRTKRLVRSLLENADS
ncbi:uncharacterized protein MELLADRAFT_77145 [Melampsora larici-populina 98AG31]|uniref:SEC7 domain-containing protein n=1 Tax=Melampsora larici-populina (strain 98AG31 / pathotype 3-4-7) TaxID=747676 RepID=F4RDX4_MELLP|nr:uncharacterized protein MELLADRAFT_77145 [Melampsora larici-populina 98AG31]EGG09477.1 hypothetical protein MELLADRAFT_77145 [Melampsora larici-populina 98AG31]